ncbi:MAG: Fic family protein [Betaproteobacteria bacterium HGW-Betaproteobacteria-10]|nr:MAG: Fic family protein [Betaproteobacteria bacterium HGW-Betaproteobacteria-10]
MFEFYDDPSQMEPLVVHDSRPLYAPLAGLAYELSEASACLDAAIVQATARGLSELVAGMNCYYSNLIEGHHTLPLDIAKAQSKLSPGQHDLKSLAVAHIEADRWAKQQKLDQQSIQPVMQEIHRRFCAFLPEEMLALKNNFRMIPGEIRKQEVSVGVHVAPETARLQAFLDRYATFYGQRLEWAAKGGIRKLDGIIAAFAAHHRLVWIHPFPDGNGRVSRIMLDAMLRTAGTHGASLWSMSRGFAKSEGYKSALALADQPRMGDLDGRGNLSEQHLAAFCAYALKTGIDQARYMGKMFSLETFKARTEGYFHRVRFDLKPESTYLYLHAFTVGEFERMEAGRITGLPERTARGVLSDLLGEGLLTSDSPKGKVRVGFPVQALGSLLPNLYPAGDVDITLDQVAQIRLKSKQGVTKG